MLENALFFHQNRDTKQHTQYHNYNTHTHTQKIAQAKNVERNIKKKTE